MYLFRFDSARDYYLPTERVVGCSELGDRLGRGNELMVLTIMPKPNPLIIGNPKIDSCYRPLIPPLQFSDPLMGGIEVARNRHGKDPLDHRLVELP